MQRCFKRSSEGLDSQMIKQTLLGLLFLSAAGGANAILIDFTSNDWTSVNGSSLYSQNVAGIGDVELESYGGSMTFNAGDNSGCVTGGGSAKLACNGDGIGIGDDEISAGYEILRVSFASAVNVASVYLLDLFANSREFEQAIVVSFGASGFGFDTVNSTGGDVGGFTMKTLNENGVSHLFFAANPFLPKSDFALAAINVSPASVPEPGALSLLGLGLLAVGFIRRRQAAA